MKNTHIQQSKLGFKVVHLKHYFKAKRRKKQITLYYVTILNCDDCLFNMVV